MSFKRDYTLSWIRFANENDDTRYAVLPNGYFALDLRSPGVTRMIYEGHGEKVVELLKRAWEQYPGLVAQYDIVASERFDDVSAWLYGDTDLIAEELLDWATATLATLSKSDNEAVAQWAKRMFRAIEKRTQETQGMHNRAGYIYLVAGGQYYKIGRSNDVDRRMTEISPKLPFELEVLFVLEVPDMYQAEANLHHKFRDKRINGEWFALDADDVGWLCAQTEL